MSSEQLFILKYNDEAIQNIFSNWRSSHVPVETGIYACVGG